MQEDKNILVERYIADTRVKFRLLRRSEHLLNHWPVVWVASVAFAWPAQNLRRNLANCRRANTTKKQSPLGKILFLRLSWLIPSLMVLL
jgi:hypothetical protein